jgi:signal transduction histidine kinase
MAIVVIPLLAILALQYVSSRRLAEVEVIARQTTVARYLDAVVAEVRTVYESAAQEMLDVSPDALVEKRFEEIERHFQAADTSAARLLFAIPLDECWCRARYYDPSTATFRPGSHHGVEAVALRLFTLLQASTLPQEEHRLRHEPDALYVDEADPENRVVYRFISHEDSGIVGVVGFVVSAERFEQEYLPRVMTSAMELLPGEVRDNMVVRVTDAVDRVVTTTHDEPGQADVLAGRFDFAFRDWELSARSRHTAAAQVLQSNASVTWWLMVAMSAAVLGGVALTSRAAGRERRLSRIRTAFVANASHEIRTPLASISVFGELLRRGRATSPDKVAEYGGFVEQESTRLRQLIDNVLDLARIESATVEYRREETEIESVVDEALMSVDARRERDGFTISVTRSAHELAPVNIDTQAMKQVFVNLLDNAMKYSGGSRRIDVAFSSRDNAVAVSVVDLGIGIAADEQQRIFHQFYRAASAIEERVTGTGLGLAIARHVVHAHGGRIEVDSHLGSGTTFTVLLPLVGRLRDRHRARASAPMQGVGFKAGARA